MVLSQVLAETWFYGFVGVVWNHTLLFPLALLFPLWSGIAWLYDHRLDDTHAQTIFHTVHTIMALIGVFVGWMFIRIFSSFVPFIRLNLHKHPGNNWLVLVAIALFSAVRTIQAYRGQLHNPWPFSDSDFITIIVSLLGAFLVFTLLAVWTLFASPGVNPNESITTIKYGILVVPILYSVTGLNDSILLFILRLVLPYVLFYLVARFLFAPSDTVFVPGPKRNYHILKFTVLLAFFHWVTFVVVRLVDHCYGKAADDPSCPLDKAVSIVFVFLLVLSIVYPFFMVALKIAFASAKRSRQCF